MTKIANSKFDLATGEKIVVSKKPATSKPTAKKPYAKDIPKKKFDEKPKTENKKKPSYKDKPKKIEIVEKVKFNNGKPKKK